MKLKKIDYIKIGIYLSLVAIILPLSTESSGRAIFLVTSLTFWYLSSLKFNLTKASLLFFVLVLPFNITIQLPEKLLNHQLHNPYVIGVIINQLIPTLAITDLAIFLILLSTLITKFEKIKFIIKKNRILLSIPILYFIIHNLLFLDFIVFFKSARYLLWGITLYFFITTKSYKSLVKKQFKKWLYILTLLTVLTQITIGFIQFKQGFSIGLPFLGESRLIKGYAKTSWTELGGRLYLRAYGTFPHPNVLGGYLTLLQLILITAKPQKKLALICKYLTIFLSSFLIILTLSRIGILLLALNLILLISLFAFNIFNLQIKSFAKKKLLIPLICIFLFIITGTILIIKTDLSANIVFERFLSLFTSGSVSVNDRINLLKVSLHIIKKHWLYGVGTGKFISAMGKNAPVTAGQRLLFEPVHNIFTLIWVEHGLISGSVIILLFFRYLLHKIRSIQNILPLITSILWLLIITNFDHYLITLPQGLALLFIFLIYQKMLKLK